MPVIFTWVGFFAVRIPLAYFLAFTGFEAPYLGHLPGLDNSLYTCWAPYLGYFSGLGKGLYGCWLAMIADLILRGGFFLARFAHGGWQKQKV